MPDQADSTVGGRILLDEIEQLRTALEAAIEENDRLAEDRDRLLRRVSALSRDLQTAHAARAEATPAPAAQVREHQNQAEMELRSAFEELQVLTEELELANNSLHHTNQELDARIEERTCQIQEISAALRSTEGSLRTVADLVPDLLWRTDAAGEADWFNQRWFEYTGDYAADPLGKGWIEALHPLDRESALASWAQAIKAGTPCQQQKRIRAADGDYRWFLIRAEPMRDEQGTITAWFAAATDVHEHHIGMEALQQSELRFRTLVEGMPQLVWRAIEGGKWTWSSPQWTRYTGQKEEASHATGWLDMFHPDDRDHAVEAWSRAPDAGSLEFEGRIFLAAEGRYRHFRTLASPVHLPEGPILEWLGTSTDVDDLLQLQAQQEILVKELQHRTRNVMAVVQAVAGRTLKESQSLEQFAERFEDRLQALARVQGLLSRRASGLRVTFDALVREELSALVTLDADGKGRQVTLRGPAGVPLKSALVQTLALALHELATNAVKHGALSQPDGHLDICWEIREPKADEHRLFIDWRESGMKGMRDSDVLPQSDGYGRELIERALPYQLRARTTLGIDAGGVHCTIDVQVPVGDRIGEKIDG
ncbi:PAS domain-containing protein [Sphingomonas sp. 66-10]|uniref:sensor histidine kinase n=1 Tax=Sphingomonas sp. 66-10 TaxID=1895848 RepID=UPI000A7FBB61|nr:PAS domain-containing protein [Sphingomonas sp. 66-10]